MSLWFSPFLNRNYFSNRERRNVLPSHVFTELCFGFECASRCDVYQPDSQGQMVQTRVFIRNNSVTANQKCPESGKLWRWMETMEAHSPSWGQFLLSPGDNCLLKLQGQHNQIFQFLERNQKYKNLHETSQFFMLVINFTIESYHVEKNH